MRTCFMLLNVLLLAPLLSPPAQAQLTVVDSFSAIPAGVFHNIVHTGGCGAHYHDPVEIDAGGGHIVTVSYYTETDGGNYYIGCINYSSSTWDTWRVLNDPAIDPGDFIGDYETNTSGDGDLILNFSEPLTGFGTTSLLGPFANSSRPNDADRFLAYDGPNGTGNVLADVTTDDIVHLQLRLDFKGIFLPTAEIRSVRYIHDHSLAFSVDGFAIAVAPQSSGVATPVISPGGRLTLGPPTPSPFASTTRLTLQVVDGGHLLVEVFGVTGRRVWTLMDGEAPAGMNPVVWDGRDGQGALLPSGLYMIRASMGKESATQRVLLIN